MLTEGKSMKYFPNKIIKRNKLLETLIVFLNLSEKITIIYFSGFTFYKGNLTVYRNDPMFSDRQVLANSADPDQTAPRGAV